VLFPESLDHRPALDVYAEWTQEPKAAVSGGAILTYSVFHPLLMHKNGVTLTVHPGNANEDGSIDTSAVIIEGKTIELGAATLDELINAVEPVVRAAAKNVKNPSAVIRRLDVSRLVLPNNSPSLTWERVPTNIPHVWIEHMKLGDRDVLIVNDELGGFDMDTHSEKVRYDLIEETFPEVRTIGYRRSGCIEVGDDEIAATPRGFNV